MVATITFYDQFLQSLGDGTMDMNTDTFNLALLTNAHVFSAADTVFADVSADEIAAGNGYVAGGQALTGVTYVQTAGVVKFDANDIIWTATGGPIATSRFAVLYDTNSVGSVNALLALIDMGADQVLGIGDALTVRPDLANGLFTIT